MIAAKPESVVVERRQERERKLLKCLAAGGDGRHGGECLGQSEVEGLMQYGVDQPELDANHPYHKPNRRQIIPRILSGLSGNKTAPTQFFPL